VGEFGPFWGILGKIPAPPPAVAISRPDSFLFPFNFFVSRSVHLYAVGGFCNALAKLQKKRPVQLNTGVVQCKKAPEANAQALWLGSERRM
jgi:hypothetical protein